MKYPIALHAFLNFCRLNGRLFSFRGGPFVRYTPKRLASMAFTTPVIFLFNTWHWLFLGLDHVLFPGFKKVEVREPVFIIGLQRSGTTFLHRVLSLDEQFTSFPMWELIFAPSITEKKFWGAMAAVDSLFGGFGKKGLKWIDLKAFDFIRHIHHLSLFEPEEDELLMLPTFSTIFHFPTYPFRDMMERYIRFDQDIPAHERAMLMGYYKRCVQRHLYVQGPHKRLMSKNPFFTPKLESLRETFPDCRIICNVRSPFDAIASTFSLGEVGWKLADNRFNDEYRDEILQVAEEFYRYPMETLPKWPANRHAFVRYPDLVSHPGKTIRGLYERLDMPLSAEYSAVLDAEEAKARAYKSKHAYNLEHHGLSVEMIQERFGDVIDHYDLAEPKE